MATPGEYFTSPEGYPAPKVGQAGYNEQDDFNDPTGKYKLVMKGQSWRLCVCGSLLSLPCSQPLPWQL